MFIELNRIYGDDTVIKQLVNVRDIQRIYSEVTKENPYTCIIIGGTNNFFVESYDRILFDLRIAGLVVI